MCGRIGLDVSAEELFGHFQLVKPVDIISQMPPRFNIAPTQPLLMVHTSFNNQREASLVRWGLVPAWVKDPKEFTLLINARAETVLEKPSFKTAIRHRRTLVPASGFYEWQRFGKGQKSQPYWVRPKNGGIVAFGGLMETYFDANGSEIDTGCVISTDTNKSFAKIHHRLPLVIKSEDFDRWLDCRTQEPRDVVDLMTPVDDDYFECVPISDAVNKVSNTTPEIQNPIELPSEPRAQKKKDDGQLSMF